MIGVDSTIIGKIIQVNDLNSKTINRGKNQLVESLNTIEACFQGDSIKDIFSVILLQEDNIKDVHKIVKNYSAVLTSVIEANEKEMAIIGEYFDYKSSQIERRK